MNLKRLINDLIWLFTVEIRHRVDKKIKISNLVVGFIVNNYFIFSFSHCWSIIEIDIHLTSLTLDKDDEIIINLTIQRRGIQK